MPQDHRTDLRPHVYNRELLLHGAKRNEVLTLAEIKRYGLDTFADADYLSIYGMRPEEWYSRGVRVLGRTAVECTPDTLADHIGLDVASVAQRMPWNRFVVVDQFAGSCNTSVLDFAASAKFRGHRLRIRPSCLRSHATQPQGDGAEDQPCTWRLCRAPRGTPRTGRSRYCRLRRAPLGNGLRCGARLGCPSHG